MFILYAIPVGVLVGWLLRGRIDGIGEIRFEGGTVILAALMIQVALFSTPFAAAIGREAATTLYVGSTLSVLVALFGNVRTPGVVLAVAGSASNLLAIVANGGTMPMGAAAYAAMGREVPPGFSNVRLIADPALPFLTDIIPLPAWMPFSNIVSIGDLLIGAGIVATIALAMRRTGMRGASSGPAPGRSVRLVTGPGSYPDGTSR